MPYLEKEEKFYKNLSVCIYKDTVDPVLSSETYRNHTFTILGFVRTNSGKVSLHTELDILDNDEKCKDRGQLSIYSYDPISKITYSRTQDEFIHLILENDRKTGLKVFSLIKSRLNALDENQHRHIGNENYQSLKIDKDDFNIRYFVLKDQCKDAKFIYLFGLNVNKEYAHKIFLSMFEEKIYDKVQVKENNNELALYSFNEIINNYVWLFSVPKFNQYSQEDVKKIVKTFLDLSKEKKYKIDNVSNFKFAVSCYNDYVVFMKEFLEKFNILKQKILQFTNNGTQLKARAYRTEEEQKIWKEIEDEVDSINKEYSNKYGYYIFNKGLKFEQFMIKLQKEIKEMQENVYSYHKGSKFIVDFPIDNVENLKIKGERHTFEYKKKKEELNKKVAQMFADKGRDEEVSKLQDAYDNELEAFISGNKQPRAKRYYYVTFEDEQGNTQIKELRLFMGKHKVLAYYKPHSSTNGYKLKDYYYGAKIKQIDYFLPNKEMIIGV